MKRWLGILLAALMLLPLLPARGEEIETIPEEILAWMEAEEIPQQEREHLLFSLPDGTQQMVWMIWQRDLVVWEKTDVGWIRTGEWSTDLYPVSLRRQNPDDLLPDGSRASDDLGFRVSRSDGQEFMHFRWEAGQGFAISGWCKQGYDGEVMVQDGIASYYPAGSTEPEAQVDLSGMLTQTYSIEQLPATPQEATGPGGHHRAGAGRVLPRLYPARLLGAAEPGIYPSSIQPRGERPAVYQVGRVLGGPERAAGGGLHAGSPVRGVALPAGNRGIRRPGAVYPVQLPVLDRGRR